MRKSLKHERDSVLQNIHAVCIFVHDVYARICMHFVHDVKTLQNSMHFVHDVKILQNCMHFVHDVCPVQNCMYFVCDVYIAEYTRGMHFVRDVCPLQNSMHFVLDVCPLQNSMYFVSIAEYTHGMYFVTCACVHVCATFVLQNIRVVPVLHVEITLHALWWPYTHV